MTRTPGRRWGRGTIRKLDTLLFRLSLSLSISLFPSPYLSLSLFFLPPRWHFRLRVFFCSSSLLGYTRATSSRLVEFDVCLRFHSRFGPASLRKWNEMKKRSEVSWNKEARFIFALIAESMRRERRDIRWLRGSSSFLFSCSRYACRGDLKLFQSRMLPSGYLAFIVELVYLWIYWTIKLGVHLLSLYYIHCNKTLTAINSFYHFQIVNASLSIWKSIFINQQHQRICLFRPILLILPKRGRPSLRTKAHTSRIQMPPNEKKRTTPQRSSRNPHET